MERKILSIEEAIRSLHKALEEVQREQVLAAAFGARAPTSG